MSTTAQHQPSGYSLHIGLNYVDPDHYQGWNGELNACEYDAEDMENIAKHKGIKTKTLLREEARRDDVIRSIKEAAEATVSGDLFVLTYSGHGGQLPDYSGDEDDGKDETWCLYDGQLLDDEIFELWRLFKEDVRVLMISDSCHSGSVYKMSPSGLKEIDAASIETSPLVKPRSMPRRVMHDTFRANRAFYTGLQKAQLERGWDGTIREKDQRLECTVRLFSGCADSQYSYDGVGNGQFTGRLLKVWDNGRFSKSYSVFHKSILRSMPDNQTPEHRILGKDNPEFDGQIPFQV